MARRSASILTKVYKTFRGVDFSTDPALVQDSRSPCAVNVYADAGGMPCKRPGWRVLRTFEGERINGLFTAKISGIRHYLCHAGTSLYVWQAAGATGQEAIELSPEAENEPELGASVELQPSEAAEPFVGTPMAQDKENLPEAVMTGLPDDRSTAVYMNDKLWIFTGNKLLFFDGESVKDAEEEAYVPTVVIASPPAGGGTPYEAVNLLTGKMKVTFQGNGNSYKYQLPFQEINSVESVMVDGEEWKQVTTQTGTGKQYYVSTSEGTVRFHSCPLRPQVEGEDNVVVTFTKKTEGYADRIKKCRIATVWGVGGAADRIVASGNPDFPNQDWICAFNDGTYWEDTRYSLVGTAETAILGYRRLGEQLAIIKEENAQDSTIFLRSGTLASNGEAVFTTKGSIAGTGGVSRFGFGSIGNEQLILTPRGVFALTTNILTAEKIAQNRSFYLDPKLIAEPLKEAVSCTFDGCYMVFVDGKVYGLDGRQARTYPSRNDTEFLYECFYWENIPARCVMRTLDGDTETLYFGTADGRICRLNTDIDGMARYSDNGEPNSDNGEPITAIWGTPADDDGDPMILKTLLKKGNAVTIKPYTRSSAKILFRTEKDPAPWQATYGTMDIFDWEDIDFSRFTFNANDAAQEVAINRKVKNYKRLQILVKNDALNEGFGVYAITKHYVKGNFAKG